jgi:cysteine synthase
MNPTPVPDVLLKLAGFCPFGSIKDRMALFMLEGLETFGAGIRLARTGGIMAGPTTGASLVAALKLGIPAGRAVVIACDSAARYLADHDAYLKRRSDAE